MTSLFVAAAVAITGICFWAFLEAEDLDLLVLERNRGWRVYRAERFEYLWRRQ